MCPGTGHSQFGHFSPKTVQSRTVIDAATSRCSSFQKYSSHSFYQFSVCPTSKEKQSSKCPFVVKLVNYFSIFVDCFQFWTLNRVFLYVNEKQSFQNAVSAFYAIHCRNENRLWQFVYLYWCYLYCLRNLWKKLKHKFSSPKNRSQFVQQIPPVKFFEIFFCQNFLSNFLTEYLNLGNWSQSWMQIDV